VEKIFIAHRDVAAATGRPIEDGVNGPGLSIEHARSIVAQAAESSPEDGVAGATLER
jgi:hypothetical protein